MVELNTTSFTGLDLLRALGSFWLEVFTERDTLESFLDANGELYNQTLLNLVDSINTLSRYNCPVFHKENWYPILVKKSETQTIKYKYFDGQIVYNTYDGTTVFDEVDPDVYISTYVKLPTNLKEFGKITDLITSPTLEFEYDEDVVIEDGYLKFNVNLFNQGLTTRKILDEDGAVSDEEITLWVSAANFDREYIYNHFGYVLNFQMTSSEFYKAALNALWDSYNLGIVSRSTIIKFVASILGVPLVKSTETVESITYDDTNTIITTDKNIYRFTPFAEVTVKPHDEVAAGDLMVEVVDIVELGGPEVVDTYLDSISYITFYKSYISGDYSSGLTFYNTDENVTVYPPDNLHTKTRVRFPIYGRAQDINRFWAYVDAYSGTQLAESIYFYNNNPKYTLPVITDTWHKAFSDDFGNILHQPNYTELPSKINPMKFVIKNFVGNNLFFLVLHANAISAESDNVNLITALREVIPATSAFMVIVTTNLEDDTDIDTTTYSEEAIGPYKFGANLTPNSSSYTANTDITEQVRVYLTTY